MELLHSTALCVARFDRIASTRSGRDPGFLEKRRQSQVRRFYWCAANAASRSPSAPAKPNFFDGDDSEEEEEREVKNARASELQWAARARELAIQDMSLRNFTDADFQALLPPHLRISQKKSKKKKKVKSEAMKVHQEEQEPRTVVKKKKSKEEVDDITLRDDAPVDPKKLKALAKKFNAHRERLMNIEHSDSEDEEGVKEFKTELTVVYGQRRDPQPGHDESDEDEDDDEEMLAPVKDPKLLEIRLNKDLVDSRDVEEVLETIDRVRGKFRLSSINIATALHRIAKHMVSQSMSETRRLKYARQSDVSELVATAMELLPECNAQGVSNIAWAIAKIGGHLLYYGEMEMVSRAALTKVDELNPQNLANIAGAFASMQHSSPALFDKLRDAARKVPKAFRAQELAQFLWSFACLAQPVDSFLDALDSSLQQENGASVLSDEQDSGGEDNAFPGKLSIEQLSSIAWSYAVFGQLERPFFAHVCKELRTYDQDSTLGQHKYMLQLTQLHQAALALKLEGQHLELSIGDRIEKLAAGAWEKERSSRKSTSFLQKDIERFLVCTGWQWMPEYIDADYSLDFALKDRKVAIEVNGPSHFARNTGKLLGHTVLKHRLLAAAGWKIISASFAEWENLQGESEHVEFIQKLVAPHLIAN